MWEALADSARSLTNIMVAVIVQSGLSQVIC